MADIGPTLPEGGAVPIIIGNGGIDRKMGLGHQFSSDNILRYLYDLRRSRLEDDIRRTEDMTNISVAGDPTAAGAVIFDATGERILLALDGYKFDEGKEMWVVPKGARNTMPDGSIEPCHITAAREVKEEALLDLNITETTPYIQVFAHRLIRLYLIIIPEEAYFDQMVTDTAETVVTRWFNENDTDDRYMNLPTKKVVHNLGTLRERLGLPQPLRAGIPPPPRWFRNRRFDDRFREYRARSFHGPQDARLDVPDEWAYPYYPRA